MKKIFAWLMITALLLSALCITAFAADGAVLRVSAEKKDGTTVVIKDYTVFEDGWNAAMELAVNSKELMIWSIRRLRRMRRHITQNRRMRRSMPSPSNTSWTIYEKVSLRR